MSRPPRRRSAFWLLALRNAVIFASVLIWHLTWQAQVVAWPVSAALVVWLMIWGRSRAEAEAVPVPAASELRAVELPASGRAAGLSTAAPVRAAGSNTLTSAIRNSWRARSWHPAGDPEADRTALLAGQAFRVTALRRNGKRWGYGRLEIGGQPLNVTWKRNALPVAGPARARGVKVLPLAPPSRIALTRRVDVAREKFPQMNDWLFTVVTISTPDGYQVLAVPTIDVPLVHAALELATAENEEPGAAHVVGRGPV